ncbi:HIT family protein [Candidatus Acetothermia bacterium]|jgi:diadenosine tetraphosphate (Ap4A) HIT family hydrolase|nr:HIT family protein [Candidatus Acetothermia bacterium]MCI2426005.1 HIT family protein [Candidatus Acetothermia bacterium]MCI2427133.1 HIT family protein [Candidatus Acetothermia bacterium]MCI2428963.1 HIT family protein [Candidatus Acetothermia bacterium]
MTDCIFCRIIRGEIPASYVYQDELVSAFMDIQPVNPGHLLIVPNTHASSLADLDSKLGPHIFQVAMRLAAGLRGSTVQCEGVNLYLADGKAAGQEVFHIHLHVIPRFSGDNKGAFFALRSRGHSDQKQDRDQIAASIRTSLLHNTIPEIRKE